MEVTGPGERALRKTLSAMIMASESREHGISRVLRDGVVRRWVTFLALNSDSGADANLEEFPSGLAMKWGRE